jgi:hypothetical protein
MAERWLRWDSANKKWQESTDLVNFTDMVENPLHEKATFNGISTPSGISNKGLIFHSSGDNRLKIIENAGNAIDINQMFTKAGVYVDVNGITTTVTLYVWRAPFTCVIEDAYAHRQGGTGATVNVVNASSDIRSSDLSLTTTSWTNFGTLQNTTVSVGNSLAFAIRSVTGSPTQIGFCVHIRRTG